MARPVPRRVHLARAARRHRNALALCALGVAVVALSALLLFGKLDLGRRQAVVRDIDAELGTRQGAGAARGVLELADELSRQLSASERRERIDAVADEARALLDAGQFAKVDEALALLDAKASLGAWTELEGRLLQTGLRDIKIDFIARLQKSLRETRTPPLTATERRERLASLERLLGDPDTMVCKNAAVALGALHESTSLGALADALGRRTDADGRIAIIDALHVLGDAGAVPFLQEELRADDEWVRLAALDALDALDPPDLGTLVTLLQTDPRGFVRDRCSPSVLARLAHKQSP